MSRAKSRPGGWSMPIRQPSRHGARRSARSKARRPKRSSARARPQHYLSVVKKIMAEGVPHSFEDYFPNLDKHFRFTSIPLGDYFITTGSDITDIKKALHQVEVANAQLTEADQRKNEFLAVLSHELRNPLTPIRNSLYILERVAPGGDQAQARPGSDRPAEWPAGSSGRRPARRHPHLAQQDPAPARPARPQRARSSHRRRPSLPFEGKANQLSKPASPRAAADQRRRRTPRAGGGKSAAERGQVHPAGGRVAVSATAAPARGRATLRVSDNGVGIEPEILRDLFQPFMQAEATLDRSKGGWGLGWRWSRGWWRCTAEMSAPTATARQGSGVCRRVAARSDSRRRGAAQAGRRRNRSVDAC